MLYNDFGDCMKEINENDNIKVSDDINKNLKNNNKKERKAGKNKKKIIITVIIVILVIILLIVGGVVLFLNNKLNKLNHEEITDIYSSDIEEIKEKTGLDDEKLANIKTVVLMGADGNDNQTSNRSDTIMLLTINNVNKSISLVTVPRDSFVFIPDLNTWTKINSAYYHGGAKYLLSTLNYNFGLNLSEYAAIDSQNMVDVIDEIGGVELEITQAEMNYINQNQYIKALQYTGHEGKRVTNYGKVTLNGDQALTHMRNRADANMDYGREKRNREVVQSIMNKVSTLSIGQINDLIDKILPKITTNVNVLEYTKLIYAFIKDKDTYLKNITSVQVPNTSYCHDEYTWDGVWCLGIDFDKAKADFNKYIYGVEN